MAKWRIFTDKDTGRATIEVGGKKVAEADDLTKAVKAAKRADLHQRFRPPLG